MVVAELTPEEREELYQDLLADRVRLEDHLQLIPKKVRSPSRSRASGRPSATHTKEGSKPVDLSTPIGRLSRMDAIQQQEMTKAGRSTLERKLLQTRASLEAYRKGDYGYCRSCRRADRLPSIESPC